MARATVTLRTARVDDAEALAVLWADALRRADHEAQVAELERILEATAADPDQEVLVAELGGVLAGAVLVRATTVSPLNLEPSVQALALRVFDQHRRRGVGRALLEGAVQYAEDAGAAHLMTTAVSSSRDANRFLARLALGPQVMVRMGSVATVRAKLGTTRPVPATAGRTAPRTPAGERELGRVLAARRSLRRHRAAGT